MLEIQNKKNHIKKTLRENIAQSFKPSAKHNEFKLAESAALWEEKLSLSEKKAILHYSSYDHMDMNGLLRGKRAPEAFRLIEYCTINNKAIFISNAIKSFNLDMDLTVYRGINKGELLNGCISTLNDYVGKTINDKGFMSTSLSKHQASIFGDVILEINLKKGDPVAYISKLAVNKDEDEVLVDKDQILKVISVEQINNRTVMKCEIN